MDYRDKNDIRTKIRIKPINRENNYNDFTKESQIADFISQTKYKPARCTVCTHTLPHGFKLVKSDPRQTVQNYIAETFEEETQD